MKTCSKCGCLKPYEQFNVDKRYSDGYLSWCKVCMSAYRKEWQKKHADHLKDYNRKWHVENIERRHERNNFLTRLRYHLDPAYRERKNAQKRKANKEKYGTDESWTEKVKMWGRNNRRKRRVIKSSGVGSHTEQEWQNLCKQYGYKCAACKKKVELTQDHVIPLAKGGPDSIDNIQPLCKLCNSKKHTKTIDYRK